MIRLTLRQFRTEGIVGLGLLLAFAIVLLVTGRAPCPRERCIPSRLYSGGTLLLQRRTRCSTSTSQLQHALPLIVMHRTRAHRAFLRSAAHRPRARDRHLPPLLDPERHPPALARGEARAGRPRRDGDRRAAHLDGRLVDEPDRRGEQEPLRPVELRLPRRRADRVRGVRLRARRDRRRAVAADGPGHGRDARGVRRRAPRCHGVDSTELRLARARVRPASANGVPTSPSPTLPPNVAFDPPT